MNPRDVGADDVDLEEANRIFEVNKQRVLSGQTYRSQAAKGWHLGRSPSSYARRSHRAS